MLTYVVFGGMLATTWVQIIKAVLLMTATVVLSLFVLGKIGWNPIDVFDRAEAQSDQGTAYLAPGLRFDNPIDTISLGLGLLLGTAGLPHILMRFFTVPNAKAARSSVGWAVGLIGAFYVMTTFLGFGARALLGEAGATGGVDEAGNLAAPLLAQSVGGGEGSIGGDAFLAIIAAVAFATILAVVAGLVISASGAVAHDVWSNVIRKGRDSEHEEVYVARIAAGGIGAIAIAIAIIGGSDLNVSYMVGLAFAVAASANFPALLLALTWRRFNTTGAVTGVLVGVISSVGLVLVGPDVRSDPLIELSQPAIISVPLGFLGCIIGTLLSPRGGQGHARLRRAARARRDRARRRGADRGGGADTATPGHARVSARPDAGRGDERRAERPLGIRARRRPAAARPPSRGPWIESAKSGQGADMEAGTDKAADLEREISGPARPGELRAPRGLRRGRRDQRRVGYRARRPRIPVA